MKSIDSRGGVLDSRVDRNEFINLDRSLNAVHGLVNSDVEPVRHAAVKPTMELCDVEVVCFRWANRCAKSEKQQILVKTFCKSFFKFFGKRYYN